MVLQLAEVFAPGIFPTNTYSSREREEAGFNDWWKYDPGKILAVAGPTKTGKTVLVHRLIDSKSPIWIDSQGLTGPDILWDRIADALGIFTTVEQTLGSSVSRGREGSGTVGVLRGVTSMGNVEQEGSTRTRDRPVASAARDALKLADRPIVIDDVHFLPTLVQEAIIQALKPLVYDKQRVVFISIGHRVRDVITNLPDMAIRMTRLDVGYWEIAELMGIAAKGFSLLHVTDSDQSIASNLASRAFGSPYLMQQFCRDLCRADGNKVVEQQASLVELLPPLNWDDFFQSQLDQDATRGWIAKLANGPEERGKKRKLRELRDGRELHTYQLLLVAIASTGPKLELTKQELAHAINAAAALPQDGKRIGVPTAILNNMSLIARTRLNEKTPSLEKIRRALEDGEDPYREFDLQPVLEYDDRGATSRLYIVDPFFAFYLAWGLDDWLASEVALTAALPDEDEDAGDDIEWDE